MLAQNKVHEREQGMAPMPNLGNPRGFNNPNSPIGGDKAMPVLDQQLPLPGNAIVRLVHTEEESNEQALVPSYPYYEESQSERNLDMFSTLLAIASSSQEIEALYQMDHNILMFIAQGEMNKPMPNPIQKLFKPVVPRPWYGYGGDHWYRDCPIQKD